jgi:hypothetical protein
MAQPMPVIQTGFGVMRLATGAEARMTATPPTDCGGQSRARKG